MIYQIKVPEHQLHLLIQAFSQKQARRIIHKYLEKESPIEIIGSINRIQEPLSNYHVLNVPFLIWARNKWIITIKPTSADRIRHLAAIRREHENHN